jgi:predicted HicB family RNase H-like nuclease
MPLTESQKQATVKYKEKNIKRIPLDVQKEKYEEIKAAADAAGEKVNTYIKKAIDERMEREQGTGGQDKTQE